MPEDTTPEFHARNGWFFRREKDGCVTIIVATMKEVNVTLDEDTWASIVASVSQKGENIDTWREALQLHKGTGTL